MSENVEPKAGPHSIRTFTGKFFDFTVMDPDTICIEDIAHALAHIPRFTGHTPKPYSVGQHSIMACISAPDEVKLEALLHDATEAYLNDVSKPLKTLLSDYQALEQKLEKVIAEKFGLQCPLPSGVKHIDMRLLQNEYEMCFGAGVGSGNPKRVKKVFLKLYEKYKRT